MKGDVEQALKCLSQPQYVAIKYVFGKLLEKRAKQEQADCLLFRLLRNGEREYWFLQLKEHCTAYVQELGRDAATRKCHTELQGEVGRPAKEFDRRCMDFWAEMAAIQVLAVDGFRDLRPINKTRDPGTNDYFGRLGQQAAYIEVKNLHANETLLDVLGRELALAVSREPSAYTFRLRLNYPFLRRPKVGQERAIREFVAALRGRKPPFRESIILGDEVVTVDGFDGSGVFQTMGVGTAWPEPLDEEWLLGKVREHANTARGQIPNGDHLKVFVINIDTASASISEEFIQRAESEILEVFDGNVYRKVLFFREALALG